MVQIVLVGFAAGVASALVFASIASGSALSIPLFYLAPLPILIAAMGWSHVSGLIAAGVAALGLGVAFGSKLFVVFLLGVGLPAWWLGYLALLARPVTNGGPGHLEWYPVGRLVIWASLLGSLVVVTVMLRFGFDAESIQSGLQRALEILFQVRTPADAGAPTSNPEVGEFVTWLAVWIPRIAAIPTILASLLNVWLAGRVVGASGRLKRPWPDLSVITFPSWVPLLLAMVIAGTFAPGLLGMLCWVLTASLLTAYMVLGFAVLHATTRALGGRVFILAGTYLTVMLLGWPALAVAILGLLDSALDIRGRVARKRANSTRSG
ncbi:MAG: DUF2232 domain-containing protein [Hyphomicrobiales bacterium]|nr:DUF2232 domain-containing protein [Hyphomicrobiales bacterium]MBV8825875.1 DUF2232 domain-containing protein [Hyphomicrobiales bacterium]MBV9428303.1 DUF2232 domain-containing protein [Bradyrhizobiaceae bacterium]